MVSRVFGRICSGIQKHHDNLRIVHAIGGQQIVAAAALRLVFPGDRLKHILRTVHGLRLQVACVDQVWIIHIRPDGNDMFEIKRINGCGRRFADKVRNGLGLGKKLDATFLMRRKEPIGRHDHGQTHIRVFCDAQRNQIEIVYRLRIFCQQNGPSDVKRIVKVGMVAANVERSRHSTGDEVQNHREPRSRLYRKLLYHVKKPLGGRRIKHPASRRSSSVTDSRRSVLAVGGDHDHIMFSVGLHFIEILGDLG